MTAMTPEEYEARKRRLEADAEDAKKALRNAQARVAGVAVEIQDLDAAYRKQQRAADADQRGAAR